MKFSHLADCHIGSWRDPKLSHLSTDAFLEAVDESVKRNVDFILISGDLFNTALPGIDKLKLVVSKLKELLDRDIAVYIIPGSHDFSATGKTMLDVLEEAGLLKNVVKGEVVDGKLRLQFTIDEKTGTKITGMLGKRGMLETEYYQDLDREYLESEDGIKIFMFHTALSELKSKELEKMDSMASSFLPRGFDYYAAGHVHEVIEKDVEGVGKVVFPGPLFPNSFREVEKLSHGGFYVWEDGKTEYVPIKFFDTLSVKFDCTGMSPEEVSSKIVEDLIDVENKIVTIRLFGKIATGKVSDINLGKVMRDCYEKGAFFVMKNSSSVMSPEFEEVKVKEESSKEMEEKIIDEHTGKENAFLPKESEKELIAQLMSAFSLDVGEGEKKADYEQRVKEETDKIIEKLFIED